MSRKSTQSKGEGYASQVKDDVITRALLSSDPQLYEKKRQKDSAQKDYTNQSFLPDVSDSPSLQNISVGDQLGKKGSLSRTKTGTSKT